ncbi:hypothetical protein CY34DRAFT_727465 [Suillus luteus UH-Slu-Lm8-n1]|uniref:Uncharacterized protein n=1 Tax=Suillus luteus UH-Slu-Lm8-n1 TaxID=930992 RepID=A0A0D0BIT3_9AGAM|nr:hypothetical protein CY34DRAFT_727465 [Suillus luteus UH-Slu-Lm8-n1]
MFEFGAVILLLNYSYDLSRFILVTITTHTKVRLETVINTEVDTRLHQQHRCNILSDADTLSQVSNYRRQMPGRQLLSLESIPGLANSEWLFTFTHLMCLPHLVYDSLVLDCAQDGLWFVLAGVHGRKASSISILVVN